MARKLVQSIPRNRPPVRAWKRSMNVFWSATLGSFLDVAAGTNNFPSSSGTWTYQKLSSSSQTGMRSVKSSSMMHSPSTARSLHGRRGAKISNLPEAQGRSTCFLEASCQSWAGATRSGSLLAAALEPTLTPAAPPQRNLRAAPSGGRLTAVALTLTAALRRNLRAAACGAEQRPVAWRALQGGAPGSEAPSDLGEPHVGASSEYLASRCAERLFVRARLASRLLSFRHNFVTLAGSGARGGNLRQALLKVCLQAFFCTRLFIERPPRDLRPMTSSFQLSRCHHNIDRHRGLQLTAVLKLTLRERTRPAHARMLWTTSPRRSSANLFIAPTSAGLLCP
mmetsp:Transcript_21734/g.59386  ORF Transcript_21734/g.59386 Transcript_21734/m.59386 type:complete len:338 (+) Transcript_21734:1120-2133(+)